MFGRQKVAMLVAEFLGTVVLATVILSMVARTAFPFFSAVAAGLTLATMTLVVGRFSGAHLNPAITVGLWTVRKVQTLQAGAMIAAQILGGLAAWRLSEYLINEEMKNIAGDVFDWRVLTAEAVGAFVFGFGVAAAVNRVYEGGKLAFAVGASLSLGILVASLASNGLINPAVAIAVQSWNWAYAAGPVLGVVVGMGTYSLVFADRPVRVSAARKTSAGKSTGRKRK